MGVVLNSRRVGILSAAADAERGRIERARPEVTRMAGIVTHAARTLRVPPPPQTPLPPLFLAHTSESFPPQVRIQQLQQLFALLHHQYRSSCHSSSRDGS